MEVLFAIPSAIAFRDVGWDRNRGTSKLCRQSKLLGAGKLARDAVEFRDEFHAALPDGEIFVSAHGGKVAGSVIATSSQARTASFSRVSSSLLPPPSLKEAAAFHRHHRRQERRRRSAR